MHMPKFCHCYFCSFAFMAALFTASLVGAAESELLQSANVQQIMQQIFSQHVDKKEMTAAIIKNSFKVYIDQFDPDRIYLLDQEVQPFLQISDADTARIMDQYQHNKFPEYTQLNEVIQQAILRDREMRANLIKTQKDRLFQKSGSYKADGYEEWGDPDLKRQFAKTEAELSQRMKHAIIQFIAVERKRYGDGYVASRETQTMRLFERQAKEHENQYLFLNANQQAMGEAEKQNVFTMHILKALSNSLDAHTTILNPAEAYDMRIRLEKGVQGIGIMLQPARDGNFIVSRILEGGPAAQNGQIKLNDRLVEIDGMPLKNKSMDEVMTLVRGKLGTKASLVLNRIGAENNPSAEKSFQVELVRQEIAVNEDRALSTFETFGNGIIGKIKLDSFYQGENGVSSENDVREAIKKLDKQGNLRGLILDFRENSGGFLSQSVKVAGLFITNGVVVISKYFNGDEHIYRDMDDKVAYDGPLIILTSKATASAAEIVAQALQDYGVAVIVGDEHTYGKGTIQSQTVTENQASTFFKVTVGKYYTVSGKTPQIQGVKADIVVPSQFVHENIGEEFLDNPLKGDTIAAEYNDDLQDITPNLKPWYMHYYMPTLQQKKAFSGNMLTTLKNNSQQRIANNKNYQRFIKGTTPEEAAAAWRRPLKGTLDDLQMAEAVSIMQDMVAIEARQRGGEANTQTVSIRPQEIPK